MWGDEKMVGIVVLCGKDKSCAVRRQMRRGEFAKLRAMQATFCV